MIYNKFFPIVMTISTFVKVGLVFLLFAAGMTFMTRPPPSWVREKGWSQRLNTQGKSPQPFKDPVKY